MNKEQAINYLKYLKIIGFSENQINEIVKALEQEPRWVSVKDKMPKDYEWILCQLDSELYNKDTIKVLYHKDDYGEKWVDGELGTGSYDVCAWMPLPKPYVKEVEE